MRKFFPKEKERKDASFETDLDSKEFERLLKRTKELQEKNKKLQRIDPDVGDLVVNHKENNDVKNK